MAKAAKRKRSRPRNHAESGGTPAVSASGWRRFLRAFGFPLLVTVLGIAIYLPALSGGFVFDDFDLREAASTVRLGDVGLLISSGRPLLMASYVANHRWSGFEPFPFHLTNVVLHCLNALVLWGFMGSLFAPGRFDDWVPPRLRLLLVYGVPLLFLTSPIQTESVAYISSRSEVLAATFYLLALWVFVSPLRERWPWMAAFLIIICFAASLGSKQDKVTLPFAIVLLDYLLIARLDWRKMRENWRIYALFLVGVVAGFVVLIRPFLFAPSAGFTLDWQTYLYTQFRMYFLYLRLLALPFGLNADYDIAPSTSLMDHLSWAALLVLLALLAAVVRYHRRVPVVAFGALFFFLVLAPTSSFLPILDYAAERRLYLPSLGFFIAVAAGLFWLLRPPAWISAAVLAAVISIYSVATYQRSEVWSDELKLWQDTVTKSPDSYRPWTWLGKVYNERGDYSRAAQAWEKAETLVEQGTAEHAHLLNNLGLAYANLKERRTAVGYYHRALEMLPEEPQFWANLAVSQLRLGLDTEGWQSFAKAVQHGEGRPTVLRLRGQEYFQAGRYAEAAADFRRALEMRPEDEVARRNLAAAEAMMQRGQTP